MLTKITTPPAAAPWTERPTSKPTMLPAPVQAAEPAKKVATAASNDMLNI